MDVSPTVVAEVCEGAMLVAFGFAWPVDIIRTLRTRRVAGKSTVFMALVLAGYLAGMAAKFVRARAAGHVFPEAVTALYALNAVLIAADIAVTVRLRAAQNT